MYEVFMIIQGDSFKMVYSSKQDLYDYLDDQFVHCRASLEFVILVHEVFKKDFQ